MPRADRRSETTRGIARHGRLRRHGPIRFVTSLIGIAVAVALVSGGSVVAIAATNLSTSVKTVSIGAKNDQVAKKAADITAIKGGANILLVGSDTRVGQTQVQAGVADGSRNDVTILIHLSADHQHMTAVSFPRDLMVNLPACSGTGANGSSFPAQSYVQFNTSLGQGLGCTVQTVESMTGLTIPYAAEITFDGVIEMSNAIGGVPVCTTRAIDDSDSGLVLSAGTHTLEGLQALQFLRTRHGVGDGSDLARISSQQVFLSSMMRTIVSSGTLKSPVKLYGLASAAVSNMTFSTGLGNTTTLIQLGLALKNIDLANVLFVQYPAATDPRNVNRVVPDTTSADVLNQDLLADTAFTLGDSSTGRASVSEGSTATPTATTTPTTSATTGASTGAAATTTPTSGATALPSTITGQSAAEQTCSVGNG